jgi:hypothetical protein
MGELNLWILSVLCAVLKDQSLDARIALAGKCFVEDVLLRYTRACHYIGLRYEFLPSRLYVDR